MAIVVEDRGGVVALLLASLFFLGTWPALVTLLERRGRLPQHTYLDYSITNLLVAVVMAVTLGQAGESRPGMPNFFTQLAQIQDNWPSVLFAMAGGLVLGLGNLLCQYAWAFVGLSATNVVCGSLVVVLGITINYFLDGRMNRADILFPGVGCFLIAALLGSALHISNTKDNEHKLTTQGKNTCLEISSKVTNRVTVLVDPEDSKNANEEDYGTICHLKPGTAEFIVQVEERRSIKVFGAGKSLGLSLVFLAGVCFSLFTPAMNLTTNNQWHALKEDVPH